MATNAPRLGLRHVTVVPANYPDAVGGDESDDDTADDATATPRE